MSWVPICDICQQRVGSRDDYMVKDEMWEHAGLSKRQHAHIACLELRLGRPITASDFTFISPKTAEGRE